MRIVCIIGADRTGKSTLTKAFKEEDGWIYKHFDPPTGSPYNEYRSYANELMQYANSDKKFIIDRYMYCEFAYSKHYGRKTDMTIEKMNEIEEDLLKLDPNAVVIFCQTSLESNWKRIQDEGKSEFKSIEELEALYKEYKRVILHSKLDLIEYNFENGDTPENTFNQINLKKE
jgi:thymidylate kinase